MTTKVVQDDQEPARLAALRELDILDTPEERRFDEITALAARVFRVPISLVSLVDETRQWFKSNLGLTARETSREVSFCAHAIADDGVLVVEDALLDPRFRDNSLVTGAPNIRFYAGAPLKTKDGHRLGTLCIIDSRPRSLSEEEAGILRDMADMVMSALFERIGSPAALDSPNWVEQKQLLELSEKFAEVGHWRIDLAKSTVYWSDEVYRIHGVSPETFEPELTTAIDFYHPDDRDEVAAVVGRAIEAKQPFEFELRLVRADGEIRQVRSVGECSDGKDGKNPFVFGVFQDVTDLRLSSERLRESEARFQLAVEGSSVGLWDWKIESEELFWSPRFKEILAIDDPEFKPELEEFETRLHADDHDRVMAALNAHFKERQPYNEEFRLRRQDGTYVWIHARGQAVWNDRGEATRFVGSVDDITSEVQLQEELRRRQVELQLIFDNVPVQIWYKDDKNRILRLNEKAAASMGVTVEEAEGASSYDLFPDMAKTYHEDDLATITSGKPKLGVLEEYASSAGRRGWVRTDKVPHIDSETGQRTILASALDVTREMMAQEALRASEERFSLAASGASVGIWDWLDVNGDEEWWSPIFYELLGMEDGEIPATLSNFRELLHPDDHQRTFDLVSAHLNHRVPFRIDYRLQHKAGGYRWFLGSGHASWGEDGKPRRMTGSIMDIHELRQVQEALEKRTRKLEQSNRDLDHFARVASHDLRAPLRGMDNVAQWIEEDLGPDIDDGVRHKLQLLRGRVSRMERLLTDILAFSRAGKRESAPETVDCGALLTEIVEWVSAPPGFSIRAVTPMPTITVSRTLMEQVLSNLITNAVKHHDRENGTITISHDSRDGFHEFTVADDGPGIPMEYHERAFKMFQTLKSRDEVEGSGIGLAIVKKMLESLGGYILLISPVTERGTAFHCGVPATEMPLAHQETESAA